MTPPERSLDHRNDDEPEQPIRCGFLFNHEELHQIAHSAPIAFELMRMKGSVRVTLLATTKAQFDYLSRALERAGLPRDRLVLLELTPWLSRLAGALDRVVPF